MMRLHDDWALILRRAWSVRFMALSGACSGIGAGLTIAQPYLGVNPLWVSAGAGIAACGAAFAGLYSRVVAQRNLSDGA